MRGTTEGLTPATIIQLEEKKEMKEMKDRQDDFLLFGALLLLAALFTLFAVSGFHRSDKIESETRTTLSLGGGEVTYYGNGHSKGKTYVYPGTLPLQQVHDLALRLATEKKLRLSSFAAVTLKANPQVCYYLFVLE